jgi:hypothetical protein
VQFCYCATLPMCCPAALLLYYRAAVLLCCRAVAVGLLYCRAAVLCCCANELLCWRRAFPYFTLIRPLCLRHLTSCPAFVAGIPSPLVHDGPTGNSHCVLLLQVPRLWWRYAYKCLATDRTPWSWQHMNRFRRQRAAYLQLYKRYTLCARVSRINVFGQGGAAAGS